MARSIAGVTLLAILLAACGGAAPATTTPSQGAPTDTAPSAAAPTDSQPPASSDSAPSADPKDAAATPATSFIPDQPLEDAFPDEIGGLPVQVQSATGEGIFAFLPGSDPEEVAQFLGGMGATIDDLSAANAFHLVPGDSVTDITGVSILALRVQEVDGTRLRDAFADLVAAEAPGATVQEGTIAGKDVLLIADPEAAADQVIHLYAIGDVVFMVGGTPELVVETFTKLP